MILPIKPRITRTEVVAARIEARQTEVLMRRGIVDRRVVAAMHCAADEIYAAFLRELERVRAYDPLEAHCENFPNDLECRVHDL